MPAGATVGMGSYFETTSWSTVLAAKDKGAAASCAALDALCRTYWPPLYAHLRQRGCREEEAKDLTQEFFAHLLSHDFLGSVDQNRGRFRSFLLASLENFLVNAWEKGCAQKRGGDRIVDLDLAAVESLQGIRDTHGLDARQVFDQHWAQTLLQSVLARLEEEYRIAGKEALFAGLRPCLVVDEASAPYRVLAGRLSLSEGAVKVAVHRMRKRYATLLYAEVARTVADPAEVEEELRYLIEIAGA